MSATGMGLPALPIFLTCAPGAGAAQRRAFRAALPNSLTWQCGVPPGRSGPEGGTRSQNISRESRLRRDTPVAGPLPNFLTRARRGQAFRGSRRPARRSQESSHEPAQRPAALVRLAGAGASKGWTAWPGSGNRGHLMRDSSSDRRQPCWGRCVSAFVKGAGPADPVATFPYPLTCLPKAAHLRSQAGSRTFPKFLTHAPKTPHLFSPNSLSCKEKTDRKGIEEVERL